MYDICHYWYVLDKGFKFEPYVLNGCHDLQQKAVSFNVAIASVRGNDYRIYFWYMSKDETINIMKNTHYQRNKERLPERTKEY